MGAALCSNHLGLCIEITLAIGLVAIQSRHVPMVADFEWRVDDNRLLLGFALRHLPQRYGPRTSCSNRFMRWRKANAWDR